MIPSMMPKPIKRSTVWWKKATANGLKSYEYLNHLLTKIPKYVAKLAGAMGVSVTAFFPEERAVAEQRSPVISKNNAHLMDISDDQQRDFLRIIRIFHGYLPKDK